MTRRQLKQKAKISVRTHYLLLVALCLAAAFLGTEFAESMGLLRSGSGIYSSDTQTNADVDMGAAEDVDLYTAVLETFEEQANPDSETYDTFRSSVFGRSKGIFASIVNNVLSGKLVSSFALALLSILHSRNAVAVVIIILSLSLPVLFWLFVKLVYRVAMRRVVIMCNTYEIVNAGQLRFMWQKGRWHLSFIGWDMLGALTGGLASIFFTAPYYEFTCFILAEVI